MSEIWTEIAGPPADRHARIDVDPNAYARLLARVRATFGVLAEGLPLHEIQGFATIPALAALIDANLEQPRHLVVPLQPDGRRPPLFLIHAGGGYVFFYRALASRFRPNQPVFAIRPETSSDGLGQPFSQSCSVEEVASRYLPELRRIRPHGPYALGGASFGGAVAFEMARQLLAVDEEVLPVILISALMPSVTRNQPAAGEPQSPDGPLSRRIVHHLDAASRLGVRQGVQYVSRRILNKVASEAKRGVRDLGRQFPSRQNPVPPALLYQCSMSLRTGDRLLSTYAPPPCAVEAVLFRATRDGDPEPFWRGRAEGGLTIHDMDGAHLDMLEEPMVATTAALIQRHLGE